MILFPAPSAWANLYLAQKGQNVQVRAQRALLTHQLGREVLVDELTAEGGGRSWAWLRAFPSFPAVSQADPAIFRALESQVVVEEPHRERLRRNLFGPSVLRAFGAKTRREREKRAQKVRARRQMTRQSVRRVEVAETAVFHGEAQTSTITHQPILPDGLLAWLKLHRLEPNPEEVRVLADHLNRNWFIAATLIIDRDHAQGGQIRTVPIRYDFATSSMLYPVMRGPRSAGPLANYFEFYALSDGPITLGPQDETRDRSPWAPKNLRRDTLHLSYSAPPPEPAELGQALSDQGLPGADASHLSYAEFVPGRAPRLDIQFRTGAEAVDVPNVSRRGSMGDMLLMLLLSLAPLLYTPESWLLFWLRYQTRLGRRRPGLSAAHLWPLFALLVGGFWLGTAEGLGRLAALPPLMIGIYSFVRGEMSRSKPIRADLVARGTIRPRAKRSREAAR